MSKVDKVLFVMLFALAAVMIGATIAFAISCDDRGGTMVQYSCIDKKAILK